MHKRRWLVGFLLLLLVAGIGLIAWQPLHEVNKGRRATTEGKQLIKALKKGQPVEGKTTPQITRIQADTALSIPSVGIDLAVYKTTAGLAYGAYAELSGVKANTAPGDNNYVLAGHSSYLHGVLFANLFQLTTSRGYERRTGTAYRPSDYQGGQGTGGLIKVYTKLGTFTYQADVAYTVNGNDTSILSDPKSGETKQIHLFTCPRTGYKHPPFRYVVQGHLIKVKPTQLGFQKHLDTSLTVTNPTAYSVGTLTSE
ncbi:sortase domain-containing protein [Lacticaseibacillus suibinensis]|uniref:sortase domain-containing protein n=1 Tax=Lacticaseibacillus suibinensis TaxID=2486011 RepID=UPI00194423B2|nr:sortase [Lacticaseibacillus suibinensis]